MPFVSASSARAPSGQPATMKKASSAVPELVCRLLWRQVLGLDVFFGQVVGASTFGRPP
jgi:hypothetical protein